MIKKAISKYFSIFKIYKFSALILLLLIISTSLMDAISLGLIIPILGILTGNNESSIIHLSLNPVLKYFDTQSQLLVVCGIFTLLILLKNIFFIAKEYSTARFGFLYRRLWSDIMISKYLLSSYEFIASKKQGVLVNNLVLETNRAAKVIQFSIDFVSKIITLIFLYFLLLYVNWSITIALTFIIALISFFIYKPINNYSIKVGKIKLDFSQKLSSIATENIAGIRQIKIFQIQNRIIKKFMMSVNYLIKVLTKFYVARSLPKVFMELTQVLGIIISLIVLVYVLNIKIITILPTLGLFIIVSQRLFPMLTDIFTLRMQILAMLPSLDLILSTSKTEDDKFENFDEGEEISSLEKDIIFKDVTFSYDEDKELFKSMNFKIPCNKTTALIGESGSGKSTIQDLLFKFYKVDSGKILINGKDINKINARKLREIIGYVSQDIFLFNGTIKENIRMGKLDSSDQEVIDASIKANAHEFIKSLPKGYDSHLGDRGLNLSGGQRQRIAIARVIIRKSEIFIFDEPTSSLDKKSEKLINQSIKNLGKNKTIIIISHNLKSYENIDLVYEIKNGGIERVK